MTVSEKSTELGYDLGQKILDAGAKVYKYEVGGTFNCYKIQGAIPADENQNGSTQNNYYFCSTDHAPELDENSTKEDVEAAFLTWVGGEPYTEKPTEPTVTEL